jgi:hypothetical protein
MSSLNSSPRCAHTKVNGEKCGSPAVKPDPFCFFHARWREEHVNLNQKSTVPAGIDLPVLEDAYSIQMVLSQVMRLLLTGEIDKKTAGLLLYALQTASSNLARMIKAAKTKAEIEEERDRENESVDTLFCAVLGMDIDEFRKVREEHESGKVIEPLAILEPPEPNPRLTPQRQPQNGKPVGDIKAQAAAPIKLRMNRRRPPTRAVNRSWYSGVQSSCDSISTRKPAGGSATRSSTG